MKIVEIKEVPFGSSMEYVKTFLRNGDYFIPLGGIMTYPTKDNRAPDNTQEYVREYDPSTLKVFQRQENNLALKNTKMIIGTPESRGVVDSEKIDEINNFDIESMLNDINIPGIGGKFGTKLMEELAKCITPINKNFHVWINIYNGNSEFASIIKIMGGVLTLVIT